MMAMTAKCDCIVMDASPAGVSLRKMSIEELLNSSNITFTYSCVVVVRLLVFPGRTITKYRKINSNSRGKLLLYDIERINHISMSEPKLLTEAIPLGMGYARISHYMKLTEPVLCLIGKVS